MLRQVSTCWTQSLPLVLHPCRPGVIRRIAGIGQRFIEMPDTSAVICNRLCDPGTAEVRIGVVRHVKTWGIEGKVANKAIRDVVAIYRKSPGLARRRVDAIKLHVHGVVI